MINGICESSGSIVLQIFVLRKKTCRFISNDLNFISSCLVSKMILTRKVLNTNYFLWKNYYKRKECKYRNFICNVCNTKGHLQAVCKKIFPVNTVHNVQMSKKFDAFMLNAVIKE